MAVSQHWELSLRIAKEEIGFKEAKDFKKERCFSSAKTQNFAQRSPGEGTSNVALELEGGFRSAETGDGIFLATGLAWSIKELEWPLRFSITLAIPPASPRHWQHLQAVFLVPGMGRRWITAG